jgi:TRAP transporter TAXI family solute receptor
MMRFPVSATLAALMAVIGLAALVVYIVTLPTTLRVAVGPVSNEDVRVVVAALQTFQREQEPFRLKLVLTEGSRQSAQMVDEGKADIAVVRTDIAYPRSGASVAVMHTDMVVIIAPGSASVRTVADLRGKTIAVTRDNEGNRRILRSVLAQSGISEADVKIEGVRPNEMRGAIESGRFHAMMAVGPRSSRLLTELVSHMTEVTNGDLRFIPITEAPAIEQRYPLLEAETIVRGLFAGSPPKPDKDVATLTVTHEMLASRSLSEATIADFTRTLLASKSQIAAEAPLAASMEAPDQERTSPIPIHQGTTTYLDGQISTFFERYGDWFYIVIMVVGLGGSVIAGMISASASRARQGAMAMLADVQRIGADARNAESARSLDELEAEAERIFGNTLSEAANQNIDATALVAFQMAFEQARRAIDSGRGRLAMQPAE